MAAGSIDREGGLPGTAGTEGSGNPQAPGDDLGRIFSRMALVFGILAAIAGAASLAGGQASSVPLGSLFSSFLPLAVSTALIWIFYGGVLVVHAAGPVPRGGRPVIIAGIAVIAIVEAFEIPLNILGLQSAGSAGPLAGGAAAPYLPAAPFLIILAGIALLLLVKTAQEPSPQQARDRTLAGIAGSVMAVISLFLVLGFIYAIPIFAGTPFIPVGTASAFAGLWTGAGLICAAGPPAIPLRYFIGNSVRAQMLRAVIPLVFVIFFLDNILDLMLGPWLGIQGPALFSLTAVVFSLAATLLFFRISGGLSSRLEAEEDRRRRAEEVLREANKKLNLLNSITRHDILNQLFVIEGYLGMAREDHAGDAGLAGTLDRTIDAAKIIERQITFTKFYQELGVREPAWFRVETVAGEAAKMTGAGQIEFSIGTGDLEVYADPLFEKVFFNLFDNAIRHGEHVSRIRIGFQEKGQEGILAVGDNGIGVPADEKEKIFERGYGRHTGFGLFLTREILDITGITILENGIPGQGARFEMRVPAGRFRYTPKPPGG